MAPSLTFLGFVVLAVHVQFFVEGISSTTTSLRLVVSVESFHNVTFDDTLFPLRDSDQRVYGYYYNAAITQMHADAYGPGINNTPFNDILRMPLPGDPSTTSIDSNFDPLTDLEISSTDVPDLNANDVHPAIIHWGSDVSPDNLTGDRWGSVPYLLPAGSKRVHDAIQGPSACPLKAARRNCFAPSIPELGQSLTHWWDCECKEISTIVFPVPGAYWPGDQREYNAEALDMVLDSSFPGQSVLKCLLSVRKGKAFPKKSKAQIAYIPICKPSAGPDVSVRNAIKLSKLNAVFCFDLTKGSDSCCQPKLIVPQTSNPVTHSKSASGRNRILTKNVTTGAALLAAAMLSMLSEGQTEHVYMSSFHEPNPKNQRATRSSPRAEEWKRAEEIEIKTLWDLGTWEIVATPTGCVPLPCTWSYSVK
eukprot:475463-Rhodomonas_salina.1